MTEEQKAAMAEGRRLARAEREAGDPLPDDTDPEAPEVEEEPITEPDIGELRERLLSGIDPETAALFSDDEIRKIAAEEETKAKAEKKKAALATLRSRAQLEAKVNNDMIPASVLRSQDEARRLNQRGRIRVDLPGGGGRTGLRIDGRMFQQGQEAIVTRAQYETMLEMHYRSFEHELQFRTLDQHKLGDKSLSAARRLLAERPPVFDFEVIDAA